MANMNVSMTLSLVDTASPQVKAFIDQLSALEGVVTSVGARLAGMASGIEAFAASLGAVKTNAASASEGITAVGASAGAATGETARLETTIVGLEVALQRVIGRLAGVTTGLVEMGAAAAATSSGAGGAMNTIGTGAQGAVAHVNTLADSIKGMALLWSAFELKKGLKASVGEASDFQKEMMTVGGLNLGDAANKEIAQKAWEDSRNLRFVSPVDALRGRQAAIGGLAEPMNQDVLDKTVPAALKLANNLRFAGDKTDLADMVRNLYGIAEARQQTEDPEAMLRTFDLVQKAFTATQGKVTPKDLEMFVRQLGQGASNISDDGLMRSVAAIDQMKIAGGANGGGGGASKYGTAVKMLQAYAMGKPMNKQGAAMLMESGILQAGSINEDGSTTLSANIKPGGAKDQLLASQDINAWIEKYAPNIIAYTRKHAKEYYQGQDMNDPKAIESAVQKYLTALGITVTAQQAASLPLNPRSQARMEEQRKMQINASGVNDQYEKIKESYDQSTTRFGKALERLGQTIGETLMPVLTPMINAFASLLEKLAGFTQDHPVFTFIATLGAGMLGVAAAIKGFALVFGPIATLLGVSAGSFGVLGVAVTKAGAIFMGFAGLIAEAGRFIAVAVRVILGSFGPIGWIITGIAVAWEFGLGEWISKLNVFGKSVGEWATLLSDRVVTSFKNMWIRTKEFFGFLSADAAKAQIEANNKAPTNKQTQPAPGPTKTTSAPAPSSADSIREKQLADAQNVQLGPTMPGKKKRGRFANYDANLDDAKNDLRLEEDELARHMRAEEELYKANKISIDDYYDDKLATMRKSINAQIAELERERAAYQRQGDKAGVNRANTEITLRKRDLADNEKSVEVQREKDLNALRKEGIALEAQMLTAEGKSRQARLAREVAELEEKKAKFLNNPNAPDSAKNAALAQEAIDTAKLNSAWDQYGETVKKIQEDTRTREIDVDAEVRAGQLTRYQAEQKVFALRQEEARQLDELIAKERALIQASDAPQEVKDQRLKTLNLSQARVNATLSEMNPEDMRVKQTLDNSIQGGLTNMFDSIISRSKSAGEAIKDFGNSIKSTFTKLISEQLGRSLFESLFGKGGVSGGSGGGGIFSMFAGLFGSSSGAGVMSSGQYAEGDLLSFAVGADEVPQDMIAQIHQGEMIVPKYDAERLRNLLPGGQANAVPPTVTLQIHPDAFHMKLGDWFEGEVSRQLATR